MGRSRAVRIGGGIAAAAGLAFASMLLVVPRATDTVPLVVLTGSMSPTYPVGSMVYVETVPPEQIEVGDVITYQPGDSTSVTSHRVVEIDEADPGAPVFTTQGDANNAVDTSPVTVDRYRGRVSFHIPVIGHVRTFVASPMGLLLLAASAAGIWFADRRRGPDPVDAPAAPSTDTVGPDETAAAAPTIPPGAPPLPPSAPRVGAGPARHLVHQVALVRIDVGTGRTEALQTAALVRGQVVDLSPRTMTLAITGTPEHVTDVLAFLMESHDVVEANSSAPVHLGAQPEPGPPPAPATSTTRRVTTVRSRATASPGGATVRRVRRIRPVPPVADDIGSSA